MIKSIDVKLIGELTTQYGICAFLLSDGREIPNDQSNIEFEKIVTQEGKHKEEWMVFKKENLQFQVCDWHINQDGTCDYTSFMNTRFNGSYNEYYKETHHIKNPQFKSFNHD